MKRIRDVYIEAYSGLTADVWKLAGVMLVNRAGTMVMPFLSLYLVSDLGFSKSQAGWVLLAFGMGSLCGSYLGGWLSGVLGPVKVQILSLSVGGVLFLCVGSLRTLPLLIGGVFALSVVSEAFRPAAMTAVVTYATAETRTRAFALLRLSVNLGMSIGPALGGVLASIRYSLLFWVDGCTCLAAGLLLMRLLGNQPLVEDKSASVSRGDGKERLGPAGDPGFLAFLVIVFFLALVFMQVFSTMPLFLRDQYGFPEGIIGALIALNALTIVVVEMILVRKLEHRSPMRLMGFGCLLICGGLGILPLGHTIGFALLTVMIWTVGEMIALPFANSLVGTRSSQSRSGPYMGFYSATYSLAFMIAPVTGLYVYENLGGDVLWYSCLVIGALLFTACLKLENWFISTGQVTRSAV